MNNLLLVFTGGGLGSILRYSIGEFVKANFKFIFPIATLCSNFISCIILSIFIIIFNEKIISTSNLKVFLLIGFCGGLSTFSTFSFETIELMKAGNFTIAIFNILISLTACLATIYFLTKHL